ncbi:hypothetical protein D3C74_437290 [compost metagenome]
MSVNPRWVRQFSLIYLNLFCEAMMSEIQLVVELVPRKAIIISSGDSRMKPNFSQIFPIDLA